MSVVGPAGGYFFSVAALAFARIVAVWRENRVQYVFLDRAGPVENKIRFVPEQGKLEFDHNIPFTPNEHIYIIYKDPVL